MYFAFGRRAFLARQNRNKLSGPIAKGLMSILMPIAMKTFLKPERTMGWMQAYRIDWSRTVV